jgi:endonuclease YncB( thermonuclease family)
VHRLILLLCVAGLVLPGTASARVGPCLKPADAAYCDITTGKVTYISDGDTFYVDLNGDRSRRTYPVRITGINAMEQTTYSRTASRRRGECHSLEATSRLEQLLRRSRMRVRLMALDPASRSNVRLRRAVAVRSKGRWVDVGRRLMAEGHALWLPNKLEYAWNADYGRQAAYAASKLRGIWNPRYCGLGPSDESPVRVSVNYDSRLAGGEWIRVHNLDPVNAIPLGGWWLRDGALNRYHFPDWATLPRRAADRLYGRGHRHLDGVLLEGSLADLRQPDGRRHR